MGLSRLQVTDVRNLEHVELSNLGRVNVFFGDNGAGKTSLLESIHLLGMGRSFRSTNVKSLITHHKPHCTVFGVVELQPAAVSVPIGVRRSISGEGEMKVNGQVIRSVSQLVQHLPLQVINASSFDLLTGAPGARRRYLDWGVFHVEQRFYQQWQRFQRCIKQRNMLLRRGKLLDQELSVWTRDLAASGEAINDYRQRHFDQLEHRFLQIMGQLAPGLKGLELRYRKGWDRQVSYSTALENAGATDIEQGYTHVGPQRADLRVLVEGRVAAETLSRGQQKLVVCGLILAQGQLVSESAHRQCTYLLDDLPSELDQHYCHQVCGLLAGMSAQIFVTCVKPQDLDYAWPADAKLRMFHVEHGAVHPAE